jgi:hypothetical protein
MDSQKMRQLSDFRVFQMSQRSEYYVPETPLGLPELKGVEKPATDLAYARSILKAASEGRLQGSVKQPYCHHAEEYWLWLASQEEQERTKQMVRILPNDHISLCLMASRGGSGLRRRVTLATDVRALIKDITSLGTGQSQKSGLVLIGNGLHITSSVFEDSGNQFVLYARPFDRYFTDGNANNLLKPRPGSSFNLFVDECHWTLRKLLEPGIQVS